MTPQVGDLPDAWSGSSTGEEKSLPDVNSSESGYRHDLVPGAPAINMARRVCAMTRDIDQFTEHTIMNRWIRIDTSEHAFVESVVDQALERRASRTDMESLGEIRRSNRLSAGNFGRRPASRARRQKR